MITIEDLPLKVSNLQERWRDRNVRIATIKSAVNGDWAVVDPADDEVEVRSPNLIQVALEDTAESASMVPTIRVGPSGPGREDRDRADKMEKIGWSYLDNSQIELLNIRTLMDIAADGLGVWAVVFDPETKQPLIQWRDPETCYPEPGWRTMDSVRECIFLRELYVTQLPHPYQEIVASYFRENSTTDFRNSSWQDLQVTLVEHYGEDEILIAALYQQRSNAPVTQQQATYKPIELERFPLPRLPSGDGICPVVIGQRITLDNEPRGQFDQVINVMLGHIRLMSMVFDYADQAIYSDVYVSDLIGAMPMGGGSYIQLGPNGKIGRVPPAVTEITVFRELEQLIEHVHLGGRWPKVRPGQVDQAIASAKFMEASAGMMNTVIRTYHLIMKRMWEQALRLCFLYDYSFGKKRTVSGVLRNQQFQIERSKEDIDLEARVRIDYGTGLGRDVAQSMVLAIQGMQAGIFSREFVQENFEGITDVALERVRLDLQQFQEMAMARLMQGLQDGTVPDSALSEIMKARRNGEHIIELFEKYIVKPAEEAQASMLQSGLGGGMMPPGGDPNAAGGPPVPPAPDIAGLLAGLGGGEPPETIGRLSVPLGNGSFMGTQV